MLYPDLHELVALKDCKTRLTTRSSQLVKSTTAGAHHSPFRGQGLEFDSVREYVPGDDVRNIDWRVTARAGTPHMKLFKEERERQIIVCIDANDSMQFGTRCTFKSVQAARIASLLGWQGLSQHDRVGGCLFGNVSGGLQYYAPRRTRQSLWRMLKHLCSAPKEQCSTALETAIEHIALAAKTGSLIYLISDFLKLCPKTERALHRLSKKNDLVLISVNDPAEKSLIPIGAVGFYHDHTFVVNTENQEGRDHYAAEWAKNRYQLNELAKRIKISLLELTTESRLPHDLAILQKL